MRIPNFKQDRRFATAPKKNFAEKKKCYRLLPRPRIADIFVFKATQRNTISGRRANSKFCNNNTWTQLKL